MSGQPTFGRQSSPPHSAVPHGLWTLDCPHGAKVMLGWLHSHTDQFLAGLSFASVARLLGTDRKRIDAWCQCLAELGLLEVSRGDNGSPNRIILLDAYWALGRVPGAKHPTPLGQNTPGDLGQKTPPEEEHLEDQERTTSRASHADDDFEAFWKCYPRHIAKPAAKKAWAKLSQFDRVTALHALALWRAFYEARNEPEFIPYPQKWLNQRYFDSTPPPLPGQKRATPTAGFRDPDDVWFDGANVAHRYPEQEYRR